MRISYIHDIAMPHSAANSVHVAKMCAAFSSLGHDVTLICSGALGSGRRTNKAITQYYALRAPFRVRPVPKSKLPGGHGTFTPAATLQAALTRPDLVYARKPVLLKWAAKMGLPVILEAHISVAEMGPGNRAAFNSLMTSKHLKQIVTISAALRDDFLDRFPHLSQHILVAHDGADPDMAEFRRTPTFPPSPGRIQVGYSGHLYRGKGIELIAELAILCPWADFLVIGGTNDAVDYWRQHLADHTNIRFCGQVPHTSVPDHLAGCQVVLAPYGGRVLISDGKTDVSRWMSPLKIFEYMSLGKAILCTDLPVLREILTDRHNALLCPPDDPGIWASALRRLATNPGMRQTLGATARADFEARYTWHERAQSILANARL